MSAKPLAKIASITTKKTLPNPDRVAKASKTTLEEALTQVQVTKSRWLVAKTENSKIFEEYQRLVNNDKNSSQAMDVRRRYHASIITCRDLRSEYKEASAFLVFLKKKLAVPESRLNNQIKGRISRAKRREISRFRSNMSTYRPYQKLNN